MHNTRTAILRRIAAITLLAIAMVGCATRAPRPTGYLDNYPRLKRQAYPAVGVYAERMAPQNKERLDHVVQILPTRWETRRLKNPSTEEYLLHMMDLRLLTHVQTLAPQTVIVTRDRDVENLEALGARVTQLRVAITDVRKGVGLIRVLLGGFFIAPAIVQVEGRLMDAKTQQVLARFARRGVSDGLAWGLPTPQSLSAKFTWKLSIDETAKMLARYIVPQLNPPPTQWWLAPPNKPAKGETLAIPPPER